MQVVSMPNNKWTDGLLKRGKPAYPLPILANCLYALRNAPEWKGVIGFNEFTRRVSIRTRTPWGKFGPWSDSDDCRLADWFQWHDINVGVRTVQEAVETIAEDNSYSPLIEYLNTLEWDGRPRVDKWLDYYFNVEWNDYSCSVGRHWLISAVARAFQPGCKADSCLIFEGIQGMRKSTALRTLAGADYFADYLGDNLSSKEAAQLCTGAWIIELSELECLRKSEVGAIKSFLSRVEDRFRPPWGRRVVNVPRQCVFAGTTNGEGYLQDETGGRRFWPVKCQSVFLAGLERDRDQIWAEAVKLYLDGERWWLDDYTESLAKIEQTARFEPEVWQAEIARFIEKRETVSIQEVLKECIGKESRECTQNDQNRVARSLIALGWTKFREKNPPRLWRYRPREKRS